MNHSSMKVEIRSISKRLFVGKKMRMSLVKNQTQQLWASTMPILKTVKNRIASEVVSLQVYDSDYFISFNPAKKFEKWALVEVDSNFNIPDELEAFDLPKGDYAVFYYKGPASDTTVFQYIFAEWLPKSDWELDLRPHFEVLGSRYNNSSLDSEEEIWIPIKKKND
jgi:AraC family transcriptional regulator